MIRAVPESGSLPQDAMMVEKANLAVEEREKDFGRM
jgi:hypothetical protein